MQTLTNELQKWTKTAEHDMDAKHHKLRGEWILVQKQSKTCQCRKINIHANLSTFQGIKFWLPKKKMNKQFHWNSPKWPNKVSNPLHHSACVRKSTGACRNIGQPFASMAWLVWFTEVKIFTSRISLPKKPEIADLNFRPIFSAFGEWRAARWLWCLLGRKWTSYVSTGKYWHILTPTNFPPFMIKGVIF